MIAAAIAIMMGFQGAPPVQDPELQFAKGFYLANPGDIGKSRLMVYVPEERLPVAKISPMHKWEFPFLTTGWSRPFKGEQEDDWALRLRVYHQRKREDNEPAPFVARALMRLWDFNFTLLGLDHKRTINKGIVDVYLCWGGQPGGQHKFDVETVGEFKRQVTVNTIYIYQLDSFTEPVEMMRELAHEYGHASLPPVGGFKTPEDWGNGYLGEKIYLRYLRDELAVRRLDPVDAMGATFAQLDAWVRENVDPLVLQAAAKGPDTKLLKMTGKQGMDSYLALALYAQTILPSDRFSRSMTMIGSVKAADYPAAILSAARESDTLMLTIPAMLRAKSIWIPLDAKAKINTPVIKRRGGWALIKTNSATLTVTNR